MNCACRAARRHRRLGRLVPPGVPVRRTIRGAPEPALPVEEVDRLLEGQGVERQGVRLARVGRAVQLAAAMRPARRAAGRRLRLVNVLQERPDTGIGSAGRVAGRSGLARIGTPRPCDIAQTDNAGGNHHGPEGGEPGRDQQRERGGAARLVRSRNVAERDSREPHRANHDETRRRDGRYP